MGYNMFSYCNNNSVNGADYCGYSFTGYLSDFSGYMQEMKGVFNTAIGISQVDSAIPGPCDIVAVAIAGVAVIYAAVAAAVDAFKDEEQPAIPALAAAAARLENNNAIYYGINLYGGRMNQITEAMTFKEAAAWATVTAQAGTYPPRAAWGLKTEHVDDAAAMAVYLGAPSALEPLLHFGKKNHLAHYHTYGRLILGLSATNFHIWFESF